MRPEYDFSDAVRGKYAELFPKDCVLVPLDPDVAAATKCAWHPVGTRSAPAPTDLPVADCQFRSDAAHPTLTSALL